jgi:hypothetical protein
MGAALLDALRVTEAPARPVEAATPRRVLRPADSRRGACAWCLRDVAAREPGVHAQEHRDPSGAAIRMLWHGACADADPWLGAVADNENAPPGCPVAAARFAELHHELHDRLMRAGGPLALRAVIHVARDLPAPMTLRGPGDRWGVATRWMRHTRRR